MIRRSRLIVLAVSAALLIAGCGGNDENQPTVKPAPDVSAREAKLKKELAEAKRRAHKMKKEVAASGTDALRTMLSGLPGAAGLVVGAPGGDGDRVAAGTMVSGPAWSTIKVPIAERVLEDAGGPTAITPEQSSQIKAAITLSDNEAAAALFEDLEASHGGLQGASDAVGEMLRQAGDSVTEVSTVGRDEFTTYGQTEWTLAEQNRYMAALAGGCVGDSASRTFLLDQMSKVTADTWGIGSAGAPAKWKGGWGPGTDGRYLVRQMGVIEVGGKEMVVTLAAIPEDGTFESGQAMATEIAAWAAANLADSVPPARPC